MKLTRSWKSIILLSGWVFAGHAFAITPAEDTEKKCIKPKFRDFVPADKTEAAAESRISFHITHFADPNHITATAKGEKVELDIQDRKTYFIVSGKLPASIQSGFARIHVTAKAAEGDCVGDDGWLIKIKDTASAAPLAVEDQAGEAGKP